MSDSSFHFVVMLGSLRAGSIHRVIAANLAALAPEGVEIELLGSVGDLPHYNQDIQQRGFPAAVTEMGDRIARSDGVIIVSPEYNYSIPGALKNAIDWLSRLDPNPLKQKPVAIQSASPGQVGGARMQYHLRQSMVFLEASVLNKPEVMVGMAMTKIDTRTGEIHDANTRSFLTAQMKALADNAAVMRQLR